MEGGTPGRKITTLLMSWRGGDEAALAALMPIAYGRLKTIADHLVRSERRGKTLQATVLVHEAYLKLVDLDRVRWQDRAHFFAMCARLMRRILVDHARRHGSAKRGGNAIEISIGGALDLPSGSSEHILQLEEALVELATREPRMARIVELRFFGGLNRDEIAEVLAISSATVTRRWRSARAWLLSRLSREG